jgi:NodT family efflux transporter outer membrane factor (OMF) lipoprotein
VRQARAARDGAAAGLAPTVSASAAGTRGRSRGAASDIYQGGLDAGWEVDLFGGTAAAVAAAEAGTEAARDAADGARLSLAAEVARNYAEARGYQARIAVARRTAASLRDTAALVRGRVEAGVSGEADALRAEAQAATTQADVPVLEAAYSQAVNRIGTLTGSGSGPALSAMSARNGLLHPPRRRAGLPADVVRSRPDLRRLERLLAQAWAEVGVAEAALYPSLRIGGTLSLSAASLAGLGGAAARGWGLGPALDVPVLDGGARRAAVAGADARRDEAAAAYRSGLLAAFEEVESALALVAREREAVASLERAASAQRRAAALARAAYARGTSSFLDVLDAERSLYQTEVSLIQGRVLLATYDAGLCKALGGGNAPPAPAPGES